MAEAKIIESKRGNKILLLNNFKFFIGSVNTSNKNIRWRCIKKVVSQKCTLMINMKYYPVNQ